MNLYYSPSYVAAEHAFDTTRKAKWIADSLDDDPIEKIRLPEPTPLSEEQICRVHAEDYVRAVKTGSQRHLAESSGLPWDDGIWEMVRASNGGIAAAATDALKNRIAGSLSSGLHHARRNRGAGLCTFNGLALAAQEALAAGAHHVLILDLDAHCGGGTASLVADNQRIWQLDISTTRYDCYSESERVRLRLIDSASDYLPSLERELAALAYPVPRFDLCLYNAGVDVFEGCDCGGLPGITEEVLAKRDRIVFEWCRSNGTMVAFVLAGGYVGARLSQSKLVGLHRGTFNAALESLARVKVTWTQNPKLSDIFPGGEPENILFKHPD